MIKIIQFFKKIPTLYYNWKKRNEQLSTFLTESINNRERLEHIDETVTDLSVNVQNIEENVTSVENEVNQVNERLRIIGRGTMMELFDTLHNWRVYLVINKKWASPFEKREVDAVYKIYHDDLHGNGQGERYYNEIMALPESEEELKSKNEVKNNVGKI